MELPTLERWIEERCAAEGLDPDFHTQREWLDQYEEAFALNQAAPRTGVLLGRSTGTAIDAPGAPGSAIAQSAIQALNALAEHLAAPPGEADRLETWLSADLAQRMLAAKVKEQALALMTVGNLIDFVNLHGHRWWVHVPRVGVERARRIVSWLEPLAQELGRPLKAEALRSATEFALGRRVGWQASIQAQGLTLASLGPAPDARRTFGMVPLERLSVPPSLSGRDGRLRTQEANTLGAQDDLQAIVAWLARYSHSARTFESYGRIVERFYLWCLLERRTALSSLVESDFLLFRDFLARPPADWVQSRRVLRDDPSWRPMRGPISAESRHLNLTVIASMLRSLVEAGYLRANAARGVIPTVRKGLRTIQIDRSFSDAQWAFMLHCWKQEYALAGPVGCGGDRSSALTFPTPECPDQNFARAAALRRTRLVLEIGATTGLRLVELTTTRLGALSRTKVAGQAVWVMRVLGKGNKEREVVLFDDLKDLLDQHHRDMAQAHVGFDARIPALRSLRPAPALHGEGPPLGGPSGGLTMAHNLGLGSGIEAPDPALAPLIGALRAPPPVWVADRLGVPVLARSTPRQADRYAALDRTALHRSLKRFLARCAGAADPSDPAIDAQRLKAASTHYLRHFFANSAVADQVDVSALRDMMGHASLATTSIYLRTERHTLVQEMSKVRRRG